MSNGEPKRISSRMRELLACLPCTSIEAAAKTKRTQGSCISSLNDCDQLGMVSKEMIDRPEWYKNRGDKVVLWSVTEFGKQCLEHDYMPGALNARLKSSCSDLQRIVSRWYRERTSCLSAE